MIERNGPHPVEETTLVSKFAAGATRVGLRCMTCGRPVRDTLSAVPIEPDNVIPSWRHHSDPAFDVAPPDWFVAENADDILPDPTNEAPDVLNDEPLVEEEVP